MAWRHAGGRNTVHEALHRRQDILAVPVKRIKDDTSIAFRQRGSKLGGLKVVHGKFRIGKMGHW